MTRADRQIIDCAIHRLIVASQLLMTADMEAAAKLTMDSALDLEELIIKLEGVAR